MAHRAQSGPAYIAFVLLVSVLIISVAHGADILTNRTYNYEVPYPFEGKPDFTSFPDVVLFGIGDTGRLVIKAITIPATYETTTEDDVTGFAFNALSSNFDELVVISEDWIFTPTGLDGYQWDFEAYDRDMRVAGFARVLFGTPDLIALYYDDSGQFTYHLPDVMASVDGIVIDEAVSGTEEFLPGIADDTPLEYVDPLIQRYRNEEFQYQCLNPSALESSEFSGPGWVVFSTGTGEITIRYLDLYLDSGKQPGEIIENMLRDILVSFDRHTNLSDSDEYTDDNRSVTVVEVDTAFNGESWKGSFACFTSDLGEPFLMSILAPVDEWELHSASFERMWSSISFASD